MKVEILQRTTRHSVLTCGRCLRNAGDSDTHQINGELLKIQVEGFNGTEWIEPECLDAFVQQTDADLVNLIAEHRVTLPLAGIPEQFRTFEREPEHRTGIASHRLGEIAQEVRDRGIFVVIPTARKSHTYCEVLIVWDES